MFTGLIQQVGKLAAKKKAGNSFQLIISCRQFSPPLAKGESISVSGVCLTIRRVIENGFACDVLEETSVRSNLQSKPVGAPLNLERALKVGDALGGHLVTGHVEGTGKIIDIISSGPDHRINISCDKSILSNIVPKGSVACEGISLTVSSITDDFFCVNIIPFTWENTNLRFLHKGDAVNLETDIIGKYVAQRLEKDCQKRSITLEQLQKAGFI
jgi:riboflavin synthase